MHITSVCQSCQIILIIVLDKIVSPCEYLPMLNQSRGAESMTQAKAKLYKTAVVAEKYAEYREGDIVSVQFLGKGSFGMRFLVEAEYLGKPSLCMDENQLQSFCL